MEIIFELLLSLLQVIAELVIQIILEIIFELGFRSAREPFRRPKPVHPVLAAMGYAIFGAIAGGISLWLFPYLFITSDWLRIVNLILTPLAAGGMMSALGAWRRGRDEELIRLDRFSYGFIFALAMGLARYFWAH